MSLTEAERIVVGTPDDSIELRQLVVADAPACYELAAYDPNHLRQHGEVVADYLGSVAGAASYIQLPAPEGLLKWRFGIWEDDTMVGYNCATQLSPETTEIGYWVGKRYAGHHFAERGGRILLGFVFDQLAAERAVARIAKSNVASRKTAKRLGLTKTGVLEGMGYYCMNRGQWRSTL